MMDWWVLPTLVNVWIEPIYITEHQLVDKDWRWLTDGWTMIIMVTLKFEKAPSPDCSVEGGRRLIHNKCNIAHKSNTTQLVRKLTSDCVYKIVVHTVAPVGQQIFRWVSNPMNDAFTWCPVTFTQTQGWLCYLMGDCGSIWWPTLL